ncbi:hypothetical protein ACFWVB_20040 [Streptomyces microflavus]|uniref:hypothetical protein n=1 Tax=Streptomyces microflavus TaxID=1919 RepID=UPI003650199E
MTRKPQPRRATALVPPHRQYAVPHVSLAEIEWQLYRAEARRLIGDKELADLAARVGLTPWEALDRLAMAPRWLLTKTNSAAP